MVLEDDELCIRSQPKKVYPQDARVILVRQADARFRILGDTLLKEVGFALQRNHVHEVEWGCGEVIFGTAQCRE